MIPSRGIVGRGVGYRAGGRALVHDVDVRITPGRLTSVVGPNGAGKSTLLKILAGELVPHQGAVLLDERPLADWPLCDRARRRAVLPQRSTLTFELTAEQVVELGRMPHGRHLPEASTREIVRGALERAGAGELAGRSYPTLSGGERQRVHMARVLAQIWERPREGDRYLLLDEPLSAQDLGRQHRMMGLLREIAAEGVGVLVVVHDLNMAARYSDELLFMRGGETLAYGDPEAVLDPELVHAAFDVHAVVVRCPMNDVPLVLTGAVGATAPVPMALSNDPR